MALKDEKPVCHAPMPSRSALLLCFLILPNSFELKSRAGGTTLVWVWAECAEHEPFSPLQHCSANLLGVIPLRAGQDFHSQELSQLFYHSHILQTDEDFLQCLFHLKFFTKSFYICSACAKILLYVLKIWNSCSCNGISCTLHFPSLIGAVWLWIVLPWQGPSQNLFPANNWQCEPKIHYFVGTFMPANWFSGVLLVFERSSNEEHIKHLDWFIGNEPRTGAATSAQAYLLTEYE